MYKLRLLRSRFTSTVHRWKEIEGLASWEEFRLHPAARKSWFRRWLELVYISLRWGEVSNRYYMQGIDRVGRSVRRDYMAYPTFRTIRDSRNRRGAGRPYDYVCLLQDKLLFERHFNAGGLPVVSTAFELDPAAFEGGLEGANAPLGELIASGRAERLFCKPRFGIRGTATFVLETGNEGLSIDGEPITPEALANRVHEPYLCQRPIVQHPQLARLHPASVNTLRVITCRRDERPEVISVSLRMGAGGDITDNGGSDRVFAGVRDEAGRLTETGYRARGEAFMETRTHPTTGVAFADCAVPCYRECIDLACRAHDRLPGTYSVGWDIAVAEEGPCLIEGNDDWSGRVMLMMPGFHERILQAHGPPARSIV